MIAKLTSLVLMLTFGTLAAAALPDASKIAVPDDKTDGTLCKECEARRILDDKWNGLSPAQRVKLAAQGEGSAEKSRSESGTEKAQ
jgi:hypothetical protein